MKGKILILFIVSIILLTSLWYISPIIGLFITPQIKNSLETPENDYIFLQSFGEKVGIDPKDELGRYVIQNSYTNTSQIIYSSTLSLDQLSINIYNSNSQSIIEHEGNEGTAFNYVYSKGIPINGPNENSLKFITSRNDSPSPALSHIKYNQYDLVVNGKKVQIETIQILDSDAYWQMDSQNFRDTIVILTLVKTPN